MPMFHISTRILCSKPAEYMIHDLVAGRGFSDTQIREMICVVAKGAGGMVKRLITTIKPFFNVVLWYCEPTNIIQMDVHHW
jgi:hypothetical protein